LHGFTSIEDLFLAIYVPAVKHKIGMMEQWGNGWGGLGRGLRMDDRGPLSDRKTAHGTELLFQYGV
jgi:hypothetical protein